MATGFSLSSVAKDHSSSTLHVPAIFGSKERFVGTEQTHLRLCTSLSNGTWNSSRRVPKLKMEASRASPELTKELEGNNQESIQENGVDVFDEMKQRFLTFKKYKYMGNLERFQNLAKGQSPKFMVIACADSRVCPSSLLGFEPGEAFTVRNIANLVPPYTSGPSETKAALEFSVNSLKVENIFVIGHSCCGGIRALMSMKEGEEADSSFIGSWIVVGKNARQITRTTASNLSFDQQCHHCEKESVNCSLLNLLTYPWIEEKVRKGLLAVHGGYYNFIDCTFEKWTVDYERSSHTNEEGTRRAVVKHRSLWC